METHKSNTALFNVLPGKHMTASWKKARLFFFCLKLFPVVKIKRNFSKNGCIYGCLKQVFWAYFIFINSRCTCMRTWFFHTNIILIFIKISQIIICSSAHVILYTSRIRKTFDDEFVRKPIKKNVACCFSHKSFKIKANRVNKLIVPLDSHYFPLLHLGK